MHWNILFASFKKTFLFLSPIGVGTYNTLSANIVFLKQFVFSNSKITLLLQGIFKLDNFFIKKIQQYFQSRCSTGLQASGHGVAIMCLSDGTAPKIINK